MRILDGRENLEKLFGVGGGLGIVKQCYCRMVKGIGNVKFEEKQIRKECLSMCEIVIRKRVCDCLECF